MTYENTADTLLLTSFSEYSRGDFFLLLIVLLLFVLVFCMIWRRK